jgi:hypothetical protein
VWARLARERWAQILRIPARCLWFDLPGQRRHASPPANHTHHPVMSADQRGNGGTVHDGDAMMVWLVMMIEGRPVLVSMRLPRRKVLAAGGASLLAALADLLDPDEFARVKAAIAQPSRADMATVRHLEGLLAHYRRLDDQLGPRHLLTPVQSSLDWINDLRLATRPPVRQALLAVAADYEQFTGWLWQDSGDHAAAERAYDRAVERATESGDHALPGYVLARKAEQALQEGRAGTALELAQAARGGKGRLTPAVHAYAAMKEARAWALNGKANDCKRTLDEATELLATAPRAARLTSRRGSTSSSRRIS